VRNAPPKFSKLWTDLPQPNDRIGAYTTEQLEQMNQEFTAAVERAFARETRHRNRQRLARGRPQRTMIRFLALTVIAIAFISVSSRMLRPEPS
jgi:hypothetical protein